MNRLKKPAAPSRRILIVDDDLGFVLWLGLALSQAGYAAFPAKDSEDALDRVGQMDAGVDLLVLNPKLAMASELVNRLQASHRQMKVLVLLDEHARRPIVLPSADGSVRKPRLVDHHTSVRMVHLIDRLFIHHQAA